jgi:plasmid stabilization system protein ParE
VERKVVWMPIALEDYQNIIDFLLLVWNIEIIHDFEKLIKESIHRINMNPTSFIIILGNVRKVIVHKNVTLFYEFKEEQNTIEILSIFDNRQNPDKLKL